MITTGICPCGLEDCLAIFYFGNPNPRYLRSLAEAIFPTPRRQKRRRKRRKKPTRRSSRLMNKSGIVIGRTRKGRSVRKPQRLGISYLVN